MAENIDDRLKTEVETYNELNNKRREVEEELGKLNQKMFKIIGKIELLQDLNKKGKEND